MTIKRSHRIISLGLACLMLLTTTTYSIDLHYCQDALMGFSLLGPTEPCHKATSKCGMHTNFDVDQDENNCCTNKHVVIEQMDLDSTSPVVASLSDSNVLLLVSFVHSQGPILFESSTEIQDYEYRPPLSPKDFPVLYQSFLI